MSPADIEITTDRTRINVDLVHAFLSSSYWAQGRTREVVERSIENSLCFSVFQRGQQVVFEGHPGDARRRTRWLALAHSVEMAPVMYRRDDGSGRGGAAQRNCSSGRTLRFGGDLAQCLLEDFHGLPALNQVFVIDDDRGHGVNATLAMELLALVYFVGIET
jgi:hypothetical protein